MRLVSIAALVIVCSLASADPPRVRLKLDDGSEIRAALATPEIIVETVYGPLTIPAGDVRHIAFGLHNTAADQAALAEAMKGLGSAIYKERTTAADNLIKMGRRAVPALTAGAKSADVQTSRASEAIRQKIVETDPREVVVADTVKTRHFTVTGLIRGDALAFRSAILGDVTVMMQNARQMTVGSSGNETFTVDAAQFGTDLDRWFGTKITVGSQDRFSVKSAGQVELWPQTPGQYLAGPKGYNTAGKGGQFLAGALIGKIGQGKAFFIGEQATIAGNDEGELFLQVVPSPWNNASVGGYAVEIRLGN